MGNFIYYERLEDYENQVKKAKLCDKKEQENKRLHSIIKEVRKYIEKYEFELYFKNGKRIFKSEVLNDILEILDKDANNEKV